MRATEQRPAEPAAATHDRLRDPGTLAYVALGANIGAPKVQLTQAAQALASLGAVLGRSSLHRTEPVGGPSGQPAYLNAVMLLRTAARYVDARELMAELLAIEARLGRVRLQRWGPRTIDLDLLDLGGRVLTAAAGTGAQGRQLPPVRLPHPALAERAFVLAPLCELDPAWRHPVSRAGACDLLGRLPGDGVERLPDSW